MCPVTLQEGRRRDRPLEIAPSSGLGPRKAHTCLRPGSCWEEPTGDGGESPAFRPLGAAAIPPRPHTHPIAPLAPGSTPALPSRALAPRTPLPLARAHRPFASGSPLSGTPSGETPLVLLLWRALTQRPLSSVSAGPCSPCIALQPTPTSTTDLVLVPSPIFVKSKPLGGRGDRSRPGRAVRGTVSPLRQKLDPGHPASSPSAPPPRMMVLPTAACVCGVSVGTSRASPQTGPRWRRGLRRPLRTGSLLLFRGMTS